jgi:hypothetical protein
MTQIRKKNNPLLLEQDGCVFKKNIFEAELFV